MTTDEPTSLYEACRRAAARAEPAFVANHWKWRDEKTTPDFDALLNEFTRLCQLITDHGDESEELTARCGRLRVTREIDEDGPAWILAVDLIAWIPD